MKAKIATLTFAAALLAAPVRTQDSSSESYSEGIYGYTSLDYDSDSNTMTAYSETDIDSDLLPYYGPRINVNVTDDQNNNYNSSCNYDGPWTDYADVTCQFTPGSGTQYTISASHWVGLNYYYTNGCGGREDCGTNDGWIDWGNFQLLEYYQDTEWLGQDWFAPGPEQDNTTYSPDIILGGTMDAAAVQVQPKCGDARDTLITEYTTFLTDKNGCKWKTVFSPVCSDFADWYEYDFAAAVGGGYYAEYFAPTQTTDYGQFTVLQNYLNNALVAFYNMLGSTPVPDSGYRNPLKEIDAAKAGQAKPNSRHMAGDALDFPTTQDQWFQFYNAAWNPNLDPVPCFEPYEAQQTYDHAHLDWRTYYGTTGTFRAPQTCPAGW